MPLTQRADTTEYITTSITADHDISLGTIEVSLPITTQPPSVWNAAEVLSTVQVGSNWKATYRLLIGPAAGTVTLTAGVYDWTVRLTDSPGPEVPVRKVDTLTIT